MYGALGVQNVLASSIHMHAALERLVQFWRFLPFPPPCVTSLSSLRTTLLVRRGTYATAPSVSLQH